MAVFKHGLDKALDKFVSRKLLVWIISTIFIPLTFIAGVYGMNFEYMPELKSHWGYLLTWLVMIGIAAGLVYFFWRRGWFNNFYSLEDK